jgi:ubiquinone/menaquinone biosynthesis C-methylase UbiE
MPNYGCPKYWDERYAQSGENSMFDWLEDFASLRSILE